MDKQQLKELEEYSAYFTPYGKGKRDTVLEEIKKDLEEVKKITDIGKKYNKIESSWTHHNRQLSLINAHWSNGELWKAGVVSYEIKVANDQYEKLVRELREIEAETLKKVIATTCKYCKKESLTNPYIQLKGSEYEEVFCSENCSNRYYDPCDKCQKSRYGADYNHPDKNDNKRFCSKKCYYSYYYPQSKINNNNTHTREREREREQNQSSPSLTCHQCKQKTTSETVFYEEKANDDKEFCSENCCITYYKDACVNCFRLNASCNWNNLSDDDKDLAEYLETKLNKKVNKDYTKKYCFTCFQKECGISEIRKNWTIMDWDNYGKWRKEQKVKGNNKASQQLVNDNNQITILEREQIQQYFTKNNIQSIKLSNNKLLIKYNHKEEEEEEEEEKPNSTELQQIKDYIQKQPTNILTLKDLESKKDNSNSSVDNKNDRIGFYIGLGIVGVVLVSLVVLLVRKTKKRIKKH